MPALEIIALDTTTPQLRAPAAADTYTAPRAMDISPVALTGSAATSSLSIAQTWNTTGTPTAFDLNVTDTASNASSLLMNLRVGGTSMFRVDKAGTVTIGSAANDGYILGRGGQVLSAQQFYNALRFGTTEVLRINATSVAFAGTSQTFGWNDTILARDAANTLAQRNGVNAQAFNIYNTFTDASNYERAAFTWSATANRFELRSQSLGTGVQREFALLRGTTTIFNTSASGINFPVNITAAGEIAIAATDPFRWSGRSRLTSPSDGVVLITANTAANGAAHELIEMTAPAAPAANSVRIFAQDNGAGKTQLMALFATGAAQQIAIEP